MSVPSLEHSRHRLDNGLEIVLHRDFRLPLVAINLWYHVGSKHERPGRTGLAHLFEHMLFQGSQHVSQNGHFQHVQQVGGVANGSTWYDRTNYYETLPSSHLELGLWLESDRMGFLLPALTAEKLENQRSVVMNERRQRVDNQPYGRAGERLHELLYPEGHPYHWPVIGYMDDIAAATLDDVQDFFRTWYTPSNAVLTLAGDFEPDAALEKIERWFGSLSPGPSRPAPLATGPPPQLPRRSEVLHDQIRLPRLYLSWWVPRCGSDEWLTAVVLAELLAGGRASRLTRELVYQRQTAQSVGCWTLPTEECATFTVVVSAKPGVETTSLEATVLEHLTELADEGPGAAELEQARSRVLADHLQGLQSLDRRADLLSQGAVFFDRPDWASELVTRLLEMDGAEVARTVRRYCSADTGVRLAVLPEDGS